MTTAASRAAARTRARRRRSLITVTPVNDAPSFTKGADQTVAEDAGPQSVAAWATLISVGPADESGQLATFNVTSNTNPSLFASRPGGRCDSAS